MLRCGQKCGLEVHTWGAARPRQHWVFACAPSPTTRPPRNTAGGVRVVGLGADFLWKLAGACGDQIVVRKLVEIRHDGSGGGGKEHQGECGR